MRAMVLRRPGEALEAMELSDPTPGPGQVRVRVVACGVCRTDLHVVDGELPHPKLLTLAYPLAQANEALSDLRAGRLEGAAVLVPSARLIRLKAAKALPWQVLHRSRGADACE